MKKAYLTALIAFAVFAGGGLFIAFDLGFIGGEKNTLSPSESSSLPVLQSPGSSSVQKNNTQSTTNSIGVYVVGLRDGVSLADGRAIVTNVGGKILKELDAISVLTAQLTQQQAVLLSTNPKVAWVHENQIQTPNSVPFPSASVFFSTAHAATSQPTKLFIIDMFSIGDHGAIVAKTAQDKITSTGANVEIYTIDDANPVSESNPNGFPTADSIAGGIIKAVDSGASVINVSAGCPGCSLAPEKARALEYAKSRGVIVVFSAGNTPGLVNDTAGYPGTISVGGLNTDGSVDTRFSGDVKDKAVDFYANPVCTGGAPGTAGTSCAAPRVAVSIGEIVGKSVGVYDTNGNGRWDEEEVNARLKDDAKKDKTFASGEAVFAPRTVATVGPVATKPPEQLAAANPTPITGASVTPVSPSTSGTPVGVPSSGSKLAQAATLTPTPSTSFAQASVDPSTGGLVPTPTGCNPKDTKCIEEARAGNNPGQGYTLCDLRTLANSIINFAVYLSVFVATLMFAYGGILYVTGPSGGEAQIKKAHKVLTNAIVGILIVLLAWLIVNIVVSVLTNGTAEFWTAVECDANPVGVSFPSADFSQGLQGAGGARVMGAMCSPLPSGPCSVASLGKYFGADAEKMSSICHLESGGSPSAKSKTDTLWNDPKHRTFSVGLFQINLTQNNIQCNGELHECKKAFNPPANPNEKRTVSWGTAGSGAGFGYTIKDEDLYNTCVRQAQNADCNLNEAKRVYASEGIQGGWGTSLNRCSVK